MSRTWKVSAIVYLIGMFAWVNAPWYVDTGASQWSQTSLLPSDLTENPVVTPTTTFDGIIVPEESPEGGYPQGWADNSVIYSDGWMLQNNDTTHVIRWVAPLKA